MYENYKKEYNITLTAETVRPALVVPIPVVKTDLGLKLQIYFKICDFPAPFHAIKIRKL